MTSQRAKRVGILTLPFNGNYGGMIQAVALYGFLRRQGMHPVLIRKMPWIRPKRRYTTWVWQRIPGQNHYDHRRKFLAQAQHDRFLVRVMPKMTRRLYDTAALTRVAARLDAVVVGSDQVWRDFTRDRNFLNYFLDFVPDGVRRISYAASFGLSEWTMPALTGAVTTLLQRFDAVSVREDSGVALCRDTFGCRDAQHVLDPTLLLDASDYDSMMPASTKGEGRILLEYVLDKTEIASALETQLLDQDSTLKRRTIENGEFGVKATVSLPDWLRAFHDADWVLTDSFHGMVFSIIFRKNFYAIGNRERGLDRFTSLLKLLGLEDRLVLEGDRPLAPQPIDYTHAEIRLAALRQTSGDFLVQAIKGTGTRRQTAQQAGRQDDALQ